MSLDRRQFLNIAMGAACSAAAMPAVTPMSFASVPGERRLVVIVLRGAMDGLDVIQPYGDPLLRKLRPTLSTGPQGGALDLDGFYALHPALAPLLPMWKAGELGFAQAVSTPYRDKRSHFDGQDILEAGAGDDPAVARPDGGWLNRMLPLIPGAVFETAFAVGTDELPILRGAAPVARWAPETQLSLSPQAQSLLRVLYEPDMPFHSAAEDAIRISAEASAAGVGASMAKARNTGAAESVASFAALRLNGATRIAAFSLMGWDTHHNQAKGLPRALENLAAALNVLKRDLAANWANTVVLAMTEFGRTARENGTGGTDHGTGGLLVMAGGAVRGGRVHGDWPGLAEANLYAGRDLMPMADVRAYAGAAIAGQFGLSLNAIQGVVFPGLQMDRPPGILL